MTLSLGEGSFFRGLNGILIKNEISMIFVIAEKNGQEVTSLTVEDTIEADHVWSGTSEVASRHLGPEDSLKPGPKTASGDIHAEVK